MNEQPKDGGPAFPGPIVHEGMSLLDYFAAAALQGLCASTIHDDAPGVETIASWAYQQAYAMLAERSKQ